MDDFTTYPELIFGLVGPIGCDIESVQKSLCDALKEVDYQSHTIKLSDRIDDLLIYKTGKPPTPRTLEEKIDAGNEVRREFGKNGILAVEAVRAIRECRTAEQKERRDNSYLENEQEGEASRPKYPASKTAYIIRQLKNPDERELLERVYGKQFIQISIAENHDSRLERIKQITRSEQPSSSNYEVDTLSRKLILRDENEEDNEFGQNLGSIFHLGDLFVDASSEATISSTIRRFIRAIFGRTNIAPTRDEFGSYIAKAAALRSVDLSRQVGAALASDNGEVIALGCNEVPKPGGGNYWDEDGLKARDVDKGIEVNRQEVSRVIHDLIDKLSKKKVLNMQPDSRPEDILADDAVRAAVEESLISEITEYGRMVHAEMNALCDAARLGRSTKHTTLYVTTYPCHNCAKHIIASGVNRVVFIEPYPKSRTELLYSDAISKIPGCGDGVIFEHFSGISPRRYRDIFEKEGKRRRGNRVLDWYDGKCAPRIIHREAYYIGSENLCITENFQEFLPED